MNVKIQQDYRIREDQLSYMREQGLQRSPWIRQRLDEAIAGNREYPTGDQRRNGEKLVRTAATIEVRHKQFIEETGLNFSLFAEETIDELMNRTTA